MRTKSGQALCKNEPTQRGRSIIQVTRDLIHHWKLDAASVKEHKSAAQSWAKSYHIYGVMVRVCACCTATVRGERIQKRNEKAHKGVGYSYSCIHSPNYPPRPTLRLPVGNDGLCDGARWRHGLLIVTVFVCACVTGSSLFRFA